MKKVILIILKIIHLIIHIFVEGDIKTVKSKTVKSEERVKQDGIE